MFFQIGSDGWRANNYGHADVENLVKLVLNLPHRTSVFCRAVFTSGFPLKYAEEVLWEVILDICGNNVRQSVGIVADRFKSKGTVFSALNTSRTATEHLKRGACPNFDSSREIK